MIMTWGKSCEHEKCKKINIPSYKLHKKLIGNGEDCLLSGISREPRHIPKVTTLD